MNERIVRDALDDSDDEDGPTTYERTLRASVFCALAILAVLAGSVVAGAVVPLLYADAGFAAGHAAGTVTAGVGAGLLWRCWGRVDAVLPYGDDAESE